jgi:hypothetical protein
MFVRFRTTRTTLQVTLLAGRRVDGRVRHEQVASLGSVETPLTIEGREAFWHQLHETLGRLGHRVDATTAGKILGEVHARIPMVTADERTARAIELAEQERTVWDGMQAMLAERAGGMAATAEKATAASAEDQKAAADAAARSAAAKDRVERLRRGEAVSSIGKPLDFEEILREAGLTNADLRHMRVLASLDWDEATQQALVDVSINAGDRAHRALARRLLRQKQGRRRSRAL